MKTAHRSRRYLVLIPLLGIPLWIAWVLGAGPGEGEAAAQAERVSQKAHVSAPAELADAEESSRPPARVEVATPVQVESAAQRPVEVGQWILKGQVIDPSGRRVPQALVGLLSMDGARQGGRGDRQLVRTDQRGEFSVEIPEWARNSPVLLFARLKGWQPHSEQVSITAALAEERRTLELQVGSELSGRVMRDGQAVPGARVSIDAAYGTGGVFGVGREAWWAGGRLQEKHASATTAQDGSFRITGMGAYEHRLQIEAPSHEVVIAVEHLFSVSAPDQRVYDLQAARLAISVFDGGGHVTGAEVEVRCRGRGHLFSSGLDRARVDVPPLEPISITVRHGGSRQVSLELESPAVGQVHEVDIPLQSVERPSMTVLIPGATDAGLRAVQLTMKSLYGHSDSDLEAVRGDRPDLFEVALVPLEPGDYNLVLEPEWGAGMGHFVMPRSKRVSLPVAGNVFVEMDLELCGRCSVHIEGPDSGDWSASYYLEGPSGERLMERNVSFMRESTDLGMGEDEEEFFSEYTEEGSPTMGWIHGSGKRWHESEKQIASRHGALAAGRYTLIVESAGHARWSAPVTICAGKTTEVSVELIPEGGR